MTPAAIIADLAAGKALILAQGKLVKDLSVLLGHGYCAMTAVQTAEAVDALRETIPAGRSRETVLAVIAYHDDPATTLEDVLAWFDRAIEATRP